MRRIYLTIFYYFTNLPYLIKKQVNNLDILAFGAHPDDVELSCGGTLLKLAEQGYSTAIIDLTRAELSTQGNPEQRRQEAETAGRILKVAVRENLMFPDGGIVNNEENRLRVIETIRKHKPQIVLAPFNQDRHPDHEHTSQLVRECCFYAGLEKIQTRSEPHRPHTVLYYFQHWVEQPVFIVDISDTFETKMEAVRAYKSQFIRTEKNIKETFINRPEFLQSIKNRAEYFGYQAGVRYGEAFHVRLPIKLDNLMDIFA